MEVDSLLALQLLYSVLTKSQMYTAGEKYYPGDLASMSLAIGMSPPFLFGSS
jgi:hypothetical protein